MLAFERITHQLFKTFIALFDQGQLPHLESSHDAGGSSFDWRRNFRTALRASQIVKAGLSRPAWILPIRNLA